MAPAEDAAWWGGVALGLLGRGKEEGAETKMSPSLSPSLPPLLCSVGSLPGTLSGLCLALLHCSILSVDSLRAGEEPDLPPLPSGGSALSVSKKAPGRLTGSL